jgi:hypothetical protein
MKRRLFAALVALWAWDAQANTLYKCVDPKGKTSIQSNPCPKGWETEWTRGYVPDRRPERPKPNRSSTSQQTESYYFPAPKPPSEREQIEARCNTAKAFAAEAQRKNPHMTYDALRNLRKATLEACRGL